MTFLPYVNRELSWLAFNRRVLQEAQDESTPLMERVKFLAIVSANMDEFFMVRVAGLKRRVEAHDTRRGPDGLSATETLREIARAAHELSGEQHQCFMHVLRPQLQEHGVRLVRPEELSEAQRAHLESYFQRSVLPVLTPLAIDPGHPFPHLANRSLCLAASIRATGSSVLPTTELVLVHLPSQVVPRFIPLPSEPSQHHFILLEDAVRFHLSWLYHGYEILSCHAIRVTRDAEIDLGPDHDQQENLLMDVVEAGVRDRRMGAAVRLQYDEALPEHVLSTLVEELNLTRDDLYPGFGFTAFADLFQLYASVDLPDLKEPALSPLPVPGFASAPDVWSAIRAGDILVHHPYHSFDVVTRFVRSAALDPKVLAIKMTLYRVSPTSPIAQALLLAAEHGKEVAVLVEIKARFDEEANISWARALEEVGAHVVYGLPHHKTHCKVCLVVRQESDGIRRYCHLSTGNYNAKTAGVYSDLGLFTCKRAFGEDLTEVFNLLTGYTQPRPLRHLVMAPTDMRNVFVEKLRRETAHVQAGRTGRVVLKMNSLVDPVLIGELYTASQSGVDILLLIRGICCLVPGLPGYSENIRVLSIIDRHLEHARAFLFENGGSPEYFLASADWMPRNLDERVEVAFPILDPALQAQIRQILEIQAGDTVKARMIDREGRSVRVKREGLQPLRSQEQLYAMARGQATSCPSESLVAGVAAVGGKAIRFKRKRPAVPRLPVR
jgi:polyphosphate kinase